MKNNVFWTVGAVGRLAAAGAIGFVAGKSKMLSTRPSSPAVNMTNKQRNMAINEDYTAMSEEERDIMAEVVERESGMSDTFG